MTQPTQHLLAEALQLAEEERGLLAAKLIDSLGLEVDADADSAWDEEIRRRLDEFDTGAVQGIPWSEARRLIMEDADDASES
jgi:hypothetical protein